MVQRFDDVGYGVFEMGPDPEGDWVKYEDYRRLQFAVAALLRDIRARYSMSEYEAFKCQYLRDLEGLIK